MYSEGLKTYKNTLPRLPQVFFGVANYWGQNFNMILPLFGFLRVNLQGQLLRNITTAQADIF